MARGFGATFGVGATDALTTAYAGNPTIRSYAFIANRNGVGGNALGRMFNKGSTTPHFYYNSGGSLYILEVGWSGTPGSWSVPQPAGSSDIIVVITYDGSLATNIPIIEFNGVAQTVTTVTTPVGTLLTSADNYVLGNRADGIRNWDGILSEWAMWDRVLNSTEKAVIAAGYSPGCIKSGLVAYTRILGASSPEPELIAPGNVTVTGTSAQAHPTVKQPAMNLSGLLGKKLTGRLL